MHNHRMERHGDVNAVMRSPSGTITEDGYVRYNRSGTVHYEHRIIAEKALGRPLPKGAHVHHVNKKPWDNRPENLVLCPNYAYHKLLHMRSDKLGWPE